MNRQSGDGLGECVEIWSNVRFGFLDSLAENLGGHGWKCSQKYLVDNDIYRGKTSELGRISMRLKMYVGLPAMLAWRLISDRRATVLVVTSNPFFAPLVALALRNRRKHRVIHLIYDLYPDALVHAGKIREGSPAFKILAWARKRMLRRCDANVILGERLLQHILEEEPLTNAPVCIPVGALSISGASMRTGHPNSEPLRILYCGNMGHMHDTETICGALSDADVFKGRLRVDFNASGVRYAGLKDALRGAETAGVASFGDSLDDGSWADALLGHEVALVTMRPGAEDVVVPSKAYSALASGQAVLAVAPPESDLADMIRRHDCGWSVSPGDVTGLKALLGRLADSPDEVARCSANALTAFNEHFSQQVVAKQWDALLRKVRA